MGAARIGRTPALRTSAVVVALLVAPVVELAGCGASGGGAAATTTAPARRAPDPTTAPPADRTTTTGPTRTTASDASSTTTTTSTIPFSTTTTPQGFDPTATVLVESTAADFAGFWTGEWGDQVMRLEPDGRTIVGVYGHEDGQLVGTVSSDGVLRGWWCELPTRKPDQDAGPVEMRIVEGPDGPAIDGRWTWGPAHGQWRKNWDISSRGTTPPAALTARLDRVRQECIPPEG